MGTTSEMNLADNFLPVKRLWILVVLVILSRSPPGLRSIELSLNNFRAAELHYKRHNVLKVSQMRHLVVFCPSCTLFPSYGQIWYNVMIQLVTLLTKRRNIRKMCSKCEMTSRVTLPWEAVQYINADSIQTKINSIFWSMFLLITPWRRSSSYRE